MQELDNGIVEVLTKPVIACKRQSFTYIAELLVFGMGYERWSFSVAISNNATIHAVEKACPSYHMIT
jgi:hypothetical protein